MPTFSPLLELALHLKKKNPPRDLKLPQVIYWRWLSPKSLQCLHPESSHPSTAQLQMPRRSVSQHKGRVSRISPRRFTDVCWQLRNGHEGAEGPKPGAGLLRSPPALFPPQPNLTPSHP